VQTAYVMRPAPLPVGPAQGYRDIAPGGIGAKAMSAIAGGDGAAIGFVDMEQGWNLNHQDLPPISIISGVNTQYLNSIPHGTSVLGEVLMLNNRKGGVGIAPSANGRVVSQWRLSGSYNTAEAISDAAANMAFGDVLLLEAQEYDPKGGGDLLPVEVLDANYEAIRLATGTSMALPLLRQPTSCPMMLTKEVLPWIRRAPSVKWMTSR